MLAVVVWRLGAAPFLEALGSISVTWLAVAAGITAVTTVCCAWRWRLVADAFGVTVPLPAALAAYYRAQFRNATLPGGVLGGVPPAVRHGQDVGDGGLGLRAVAWERSLGQAVQAVLTLLVLLLVSFPALVSAPALVARPAVVGPGVAVLVLLALAAVAVGMVLLRRPRSGRRRRAGLLSDVAEDLRRIVACRGLLGIVLSSTVATSGYAAMFVAAAHVSGVAVSAGRLLPVALVVLLVSALPVNIAGWGPREGGAAWAFGAVGLGAAQGVTTAVVFGVMVLVATLPGAAVLVAVRRRDRPPVTRESASADYGPVGVAHG